MCACACARACVCARPFVRAQYCTACRAFSAVSASAPAVWGAVAGARRTVASLSLSRAPCALPAHGDGTGHTRVGVQEGARAWVSTAPLSVIWCNICSCRHLREAAGCCCSHAVCRAREVRWAANLDCDLARLPGGDGRRRYQRPEDRAARAPANLLLEVDVRRRDACPEVRKQVSSAGGGRQGKGGRARAAGQGHRSWAGRRLARPSRPCRQF